MREIKFRGKDLKTGEWVYGDLHLLCDAPHIHTAPSQFPYAGKRSFIDKDTIGQFTGLLDINGREIYEGDVVRVRVTNDRFKRNPRFEIGSVKYDDYYGRWDNGFHGRFFSNRMEVIGNIHDNPELLKGGKG